MADIQDALLDAMSYIAEKKIESAGLDKTVQGTIEKCLDATLGQYLVSYAGGTMNAYAAGDKAYQSKQSVYVLVPKGDFSNKKIILDSASSLNGDFGAQYVSNVLSDMDFVGDNAIVKGGDNAYYLSAFVPVDSKTLYEFGGSNNSLSVDNESFIKNMNKATALLVRTKVFSGGITRQMRIDRRGVYGLYLLVEDENGTQQQIVFDTSRMMSDPYSYDQFYTQYDIFDMTNFKFKRVNKIYIESRNFVDEEDSFRANDRSIGFKDIELYALTNVSEESMSGDYRLTMRPEAGTTFSTSSDPEKGSLTFRSYLWYKTIHNLSDEATFYWYKEDPTISIMSKEYEVYGGNGWRRVPSSTKQSIMTIYKSDNRAAETKYKVVCRYKDSITLRKTFTVSNPSAQHRLEITSNGTEFSNEDDIAMMKISIDGGDSPLVDDSRLTDNEFNVIWSKSDQGLSNYTSFDSSIEELQARLADADRSERNSINALINEYTDVDFTKLTLNYPIKKIRTAATFTATLYIGEYAYGSASIDISRVDPTASYSNYVSIVNGSQSFKYSEYGVAPTSNRYAEPQQVMPLSVQFFNDKGTEVPQTDYSYRWIVPNGNSFIAAFDDATPYNSDDTLRYIDGKGSAEELVFSIVDTYDYSAYNNQIEVVVDYDGVTYRGVTDFLFTKVGDNGTNGTDVVGRVVVERHTDLPGVEAGTLPYSLVQKDGDGYSIVKASTYSLLAYNKANAVLNSPVKWGYVGLSREIPFELNTSTSFESGATLVPVLQDGIVASKEQLQSAIVKAEFHLGSISERYYAFAPFIAYEGVCDDEHGYPILYNLRTLKEIVYTSAGRNPRYNTKQGIHVGWSIDGNDVLETESEYTISVDCSGVIENMTLVDKTYYIVGGVANSYNGENTNNSIVIEFKKGNEILGTLFVPVHVSLNRYEVEALNAWDGSNIEIATDKGYILAPQIGAGGKNEDNSFTGILMGTEKRWIEDNKYETNTGLLGYSSGERSVFIDANSGKAELGTPETGQIIMDPSGTSMIGNWYIGDRQLYSMSRADGESFDKSVADRKPGNLSKPVKDAEFAVPYDAQGIILSAAPAYVSIKGLPLDEESDIKFGEPDTIVVEGNSFEVEIDPQKSSLFTIFKHYEEDGKHKREAVVGINDKGRFYTGAVQSGELDLGIGPVRAFDQQTVATTPYSGAITSIGSSDTLLKYYINKTETNGTLHFSSGMDGTNEYNRPYAFHAKSFGFYASPDGSSSTVTTGSGLIIDKDGVTLGTDFDQQDDYHRSQFVKIKRPESLISSKGSLNARFNDTNANINIGGNIDTSISGYNILNVDQQYDITVNGTDGYAVTTIKGNSTITVPKDKKIRLGLAEDVSYFNLSNNQASVKVDTAEFKLSSDDESYISTPRGGLRLETCQGKSGGTDGNIRLITTRQQDSGSGQEIRFELFNTDENPSPGVDSLSMSMYLDTISKNSYVKWITPAADSMVFGDIIHGTKDTANARGLQVNPGIRTSYFSVKGGTTSPIGDGIVVAVEEGHVALGDKGTDIDKKSNLTLKNGDLTISAGRAKILGEKNTSTNRGLEVDEVIRTNSFIDVQDSYVTVDSIAAWWDAKNRWGSYSSASAIVTAATQASAGSISSVSNRVATLEEKASTWDGKADKPTVGNYTATTVTGATTLDDLKTACNTYFTAIYLMLKQL